MNYVPNHTKICLDQIGCILILLVITMSCHHFICHCVMCEIVTANVCLFQNVAYLAPLPIVKLEKEKAEGDAQTINWTFYEMNSNAVNVLPAS